MTFGQWIREQRLSQRKTALECAQRAKMTPSVWSRWECDESRRRDGNPSQPRRTTVEAIAFALDVPLWDAMAAAGYAESGVRSPDRDWSYILDGLTESQQKIVLSIAKAARDSLLEASTAA